MPWETTKGNDWNHVLFKIIETVNKLCHLLQLSPIILTLFQFISTPLNLSINQVLAPQGIFTSNVHSSWHVTATAPTWFAGRTRAFTGEWPKYAAKEKSRSNTWPEGCKQQQGSATDTSSNCFSINNLHSSCCFNCMEHLQALLMVFNVPTLPCTAAKAAVLFFLWSWWSWCWFEERVFVPSLASLALGVQALLQPVASV